MRIEKSQIQSLRASVDAARRHAALFLLDLDAVEAQLDRIEGVKRPEVNRNWRREIAGCLQRKLARPVAQ